MRPLIICTLIAGLLLAPNFARANFFKKFGFGKKSTSSLGTAALSQDQMVSGLKEALGKGVDKAIATLGQTNGFLSNPDVKIPMPEKLEKVERTLRALRQDKMADDFVETMNHAAEEAVPAASSVFADAVQKMSIQDAKELLTGPDDAATQYFRKATETNLFERFLPIVKNATEKTGVTSSYKNLMAKAGGIGSPSGALGGFGKTLGADKYLSQDAVDIDQYVTEKTLDGLFKQIAEQEKLIRENPAARTTDLLQKVFGAVSK